MRGGGIQVRIRGTRSLTASNDPLHVLDGIPLSGGLQSINPIAYDGYYYNET